MPKLSKGHNSGNIVYKVAFPTAIFTTGEFYYGGKICYFPGVGVGGGILLFYCRKISKSFFWGEILVAGNHSRFFGGGGRGFAGGILVADNHSCFSGRGEGENGYMTASTHCLL